MASRISLDDFAALAMSEFGTIDIRRAQAKTLRAKYDVGIPRLVFKNENKIDVGLFRIPGDPDAGTSPAPATPAVNVADTASATANGNPLAVENFNGIKVYSAPLNVSLIPERDKNFVAWGNYHLIKKMLKAEEFLSVYVTGETGNGKTFNFEQAAASLGIELVAVNFTAQTDEDDLIGGFRLVGGDTVWVDGPVLEAMKRGACLLLDEVDLATEPVMALQSVLQGKPYFVKKLGRLVTPAPGFKVVATANTKGDGDGDYAYTNVLNKAFLDRFKILIEQPYPPLAVERKILTKYVEQNCPHVEPEWIESVTRLVDIVRSTYKDGSISEQISTRRAVDMTQMYGLLGNATEAIKLTTNRFDTDVQDAILTLWDNIDSTPDPESIDDGSSMFEEEEVTADPTGPATVTPPNASYTPQAVVPPPASPTVPAGTNASGAPNIPF